MKDNFSKKEFEEIRREIISMLMEIDSKRKNSYHNTEHSVNVEFRAITLCLICDCGKKTMQLVIIAALFHDFDHCGKTIRTEKDGLSNEEHAAMCAEIFLKSKDLSQKSIDFIKNLIIGTTFGNPDIKPITKIEKILAFADIACYKDGWEAFFKDSINLLKETPKSARPSDFITWMQNEKSFIEYIKSRAVKESKIWDKELSEVEKMITAIISNDSSVSKEIEQKRKIFCSIK